MTVPVPTSLPVVSGWSVADWLDRSYHSTPAAADGIATITLPPVPDGERWQLTHMVAGCTSPLPTVMRLYLDEAADANLRDGTSSGAFDVADWPLGLWIPPGRTLLARWTGAAVGAVAVLTVQATIFRRNS